MELFIKQFKLLFIIFINTVPGNYYPTFSIAVFILRASITNIKTSHANCLVTRVQGLSFVNAESKNGSGTMIFSRLSLISNADEIIFFYINTFYINLVR